MGATAPVAVETAGATVPAVEAADVVLVEVTAFAAVAGVRVADVLSAPATGASAPVVVPASEAGAWVTAAIGALPEVAVEGADPADDAVGTADLAEAELTVPDPELVALAEGLGAAAPTPDVADEAVEETCDVAELTADVTGLVAELTAEVTGDAVELTAEVTAERGDVGSVSEVAACACRENRSMITKIPAAAIASCTARRAMQRRIGCGMTSSHSPETGRGTRAHY
jgi:hypothetical protein